jgi:hypothetical protein
MQRVIAPARHTGNMLLRIEQLVNNPHSECRIKTPLNMRRNPLTPPRRGEGDGTCSECFDPHFQCTPIQAIDGEELNFRHDWHFGWDFFGRRTGWRAHVLHVNT